MNHPPPRGAPTGWVIEIELPGELRVRDPEGQLALETDDLDAALVPWLQSVIAQQGCVLYSGSGLLGEDGRIAFEVALTNATLVCGWAQHRW